MENDDDEKLRKTTFAGEEKINSDTLIDTHGAYVVAPRNVAHRLNVPLWMPQRLLMILRQS